MQIDGLIGHYDDVDTLYAEVLETKGATNQKIKAIEEMSELTKEIAKDLQGIGDTDHLLLELADVEILCEQLRLIYDQDGHATDDYKTKQLQRLADRLVNEEL